MTAGVVKLPLEEPARFNPSQLEALCDRIGELRAEAEVASALDRLARYLEEIAHLRTLRAGRSSALKQVLASLVQDASLIGMSTLSRVGRDVLDCLSHDDPAALAATLARLDRVGERSIHAIWDFEDLSS